MRMRTAWVAAMLLLALLRSAVAMHFTLEDALQAGLETACCPQHDEQSHPHIHPTLNVPFPPVPDCAPCEAAIQQWHIPTYVLSLDDQKAKEMQEAHAEHLRKSQYNDAENDIYVNNAEDAYGIHNSPKHDEITRPHDEPDRPDDDVPSAHIATIKVVTSKDGKHRLINVQVEDNSPRTGWTGPVPGVHTMPGDDFENDNGSPASTGTPATPGTPPEAKKTDPTQPAPTPDLATHVVVGSHVPKVPPQPLYVDPDSLPNPFDGASISSGKAEAKGYTQLAPVLPDNAIKPPPVTPPSPVPTTVYQQCFPTATMRASVVAGVGNYRALLTAMGATGKTLLDVVDKSPVCEKNVKPCLTKEAFAAVTTFEAHLPKEGKDFLKQAKEC